MEESLGQYIVAGIVTIVLAYMQQRTKASVDAATKSATIAAKAAADETKAVKNDLADNTKDTKTLLQVTSATKILVNSGMAAQLQAHAVTARRLADLTQNAADLKLAEIAEKELSEHYVKHCIEAHCPFAGPPAKEP